LTFLRFDVHEHPRPGTVSARRSYPYRGQDRGDAANAAYLAAFSATG
jgi:hypothetical protein